ncbi:hypothetical protein J7E81_08195 [Bacillus sp. ISL-18]|uniref:zinc-dependent metalloprotease n=1 Tax=Bacillus sp. ISL-18 TaxID=2819118 RepID=UPI001BECB5BC|nr:zinc-dependent metalloprotease [Bacillus sp. ISL-18]MBT2655222.1 hypothetical protein [Bacillus sp. ISL-18]
MLARVQADIRRSNEVWNTGIAPGVACGINFVSSRVFYRPDYTIPASTVADNSDPRVVSLLNDIKTQTNNATAIYVVYLSEQTLSSGAIGNAGPVFSFFNSTTDFGLVGHAVISDGAFDSYALAHESGHVLFGRFLNNNDPNSFTINDPSNPGSGHNNDPQNVMFPIIPASNPFINGTQCSVARQSRVVLNDPVSASGFVSTVNAAGFSSASANEPFDSFESNSSFVPVESSDSEDCGCHQKDMRRRMMEPLSSMVNSGAFSSTGDADQFESFESCSSGDCRRHHRKRKESREVKMLNQQVSQMVKRLGPDKVREVPLKCHKKRKCCKDREY